MDLKHDVNIVRAQTPFIAVVFAVFACASRIVDDPRLSGQDDVGLGMVFYERYAMRMKDQYHLLTATIPQRIDSSLHQPSIDPNRSCAMHCSPFFLPLRSKLPPAGLVACGPGSSYVPGPRPSCKSRLHRATHDTHCFLIKRTTRLVNMTPVEKQVRRKVFWSVYSLDRMLAMTLGRPLGIEDSDCDAELPFEFDDDDLEEEEEEEEYEPPPPQRRRRQQQTQQKGKGSGGPLGGLGGVSAVLPVDNVGETAGKLVNSATGTLSNVAGGAVNKQGGGDKGGKSDTLRLRLDLNLEVEITLKARIHGDLELALL